MKRYYILPLAGLMAMPLAAQNVVDGVRFGSTDITGTARYRAMGGAFGALGGDPTSMTDNPAGMGVYRGTCEISFTPNLSFAKSTVNASAKTNVKKADCSVSNLAYILSIKTPQCDHLVNFNIGIGFNHSEGLARRYKMTLDEPEHSFGQYLANRANNALLYTGNYNNADYLGSDHAWKNSTIPMTAVLAYDCYAIDDMKDAQGKAIGGVAAYDQTEGLESYQRLYVKESTRNDEYNANISGNWDDVVYGGFTFTVNDFNSTIESDLEEDYSYDYQGDYTIFLNDLETKGTGIGMKLGVIVKPIYNWRIGFAAHSPTWFWMEDFFSCRMKTNDPRVKDPNKFSGGEIDNYKYRYQTPWQMQLSSAWVIGKKGIISIEADMKDFTTQKYKVRGDDWDDDDMFGRTNQLFKDYTRVQMTYKVGGEYRVTDHFSTRLGYAYKTSPFDQDLYDHPEVFRYQRRGAFQDDNTGLFDSSTKPNYSLLGSQEYYTGGMGWSGEWWHIDLSCMAHIRHEKVAAYPTTGAIKSIAANGNVEMTDDPSYGATIGTHRHLKTRTLAWDLTIGLKF